MKQLMMALSLVLLATPAWAKKPCEELKSEIDARLQAKGVKSYTLEIVANDAATKGTVIGSCDGGSRKIIYMKG